MKIVIRIFNVIIMAIAAAATVFLFTTPAISFNSKIDVNVKTFSEFVPVTQYTDEYDIATLLGTDTIHTGIQFSLKATELNHLATGNRDVINEAVLNKNVDNMIVTLHEPIDLIADFSIRAIIKSTIKDEISKQIEGAKNEFGGASSAQDIMDEVGMDDDYFNNFSLALYDSANADDSTIDSVSGVLYEQIDDALARAEESGLVDSSGFSNDKKDGITENLLKVLSDLNLVNEDGTIKQISSICYIYLSNFMKGRLDGKVEASTLDQQVGESTPDYADRMTRLYVVTMMPDGFYQGASAIAIGLIVGMFIFAALWVFIFIFTLIRTFTKKPWTMFGPWFWVLGPLMLVLGFGITFGTKVLLPSVKLPLDNLPINSVLISIRTYALIPSILFVVMIAVGIVYAIFRSMAKADYRDELEAKGAK